MDAAGLALTLSLAIADLADVSAQGRRIACQIRAGGRGWSWRQIDGKRCWYQGRRQIPKAQLYWPSPPQRAPVEVWQPAPAPPMPPVPARAPAVLPAAMVFAPPDPSLGLVTDEAERWTPPPPRQAVRTVSYRAAADVPRLSDAARGAVVLAFMGFAALMAFAGASIFWKRAGGWNP